ncbi:MAG TPA: RNA polymerase sigma factor [Thermoanaerobaculia bacterium]|jgi:RNA polymerase sigma-70 factor (ECF subfamily)
MIDTMSLSLVIRNMTMTESRDLDGARSVMSEDEFRAFYDRTARSLWSYLSRITDRQQADDLLQEAYYRFYRLGKRHESESHRRNSLFQIATNLAIDVARRASRYQHVPLPEEEDASPAAVPRSDAPVPERQAEIRTDLGRALKRLEPLQREILWLAYAQGVSHEEIAQIIGVRAISVRTLLLRARRKLAAILKGRAR